jgi:hypothetical protein
MTLPAGSPPVAGPTAAVANSAIGRAWQAALASEQTAVYGYSALGPRLGDPAQLTQAHADQQAHRALAELTREQLLAAGQPAPEPAAYYPLPYPLTGATAAQQLALRLETATATAWRYLLATAASTTPSGSPTASASVPGLSPAGLGALRGAALSALTASAVRAYGWRRLVSPASATVAFPGI